MKTMSIDKAVIHTANNNAETLKLERNTILQTRILKDVKKNNIIPCPMLA